MGSELLDMPSDMLQRILCFIGNGEFDVWCIVRVSCSQLCSMMAQPNYASTVTWEMFSLSLDSLCRMHFAPIAIRMRNRNTAQHSLYIPVDVVRYYHQQSAFDLACEVVHHFNQMPVFAQEAAYKQYSFVLHTLGEHLRPCLETYVDFRSSLLILNSMSPHSCVSYPQCHHGTHECIDAAVSATPMHMSYTSPSGSPVM